MQAVGHWEFEAKIQLHGRGGVHRVGVSVRFEPVPLSVIAKASGLVVCVGVGSYIAYTLCLRFFKCETFGELISKINSELYHYDKSRTTNKRLKSNPLSAHTCASTSVGSVKLSVDDDQFVFSADDKCVQILLSKKPGRKRQRSNPKSSAKVFSSNGKRRPETLDSIWTPRGKLLRVQPPIYRTSALSDLETRKVDTQDDQSSGCSTSPPPIDRRPFKPTNIQRVLEETSSVTSSAQQSFAWDALYTPDSVNQEVVSAFERACVSINCHNATYGNPAHLINDNCDFALLESSVDNLTSSTIGTADQNSLIRRLLESITCDEVNSNSNGRPTSPFSSSDAASELSSSLAFAVPASLASGDGHLAARTAALFAAAAGSLSAARQEMRDCQRQFFGQEGGIDAQRYSWLSSREYARALYTSTVVADDTSSVCSGWLIDGEGRQQFFQPDSVVDIGLAGILGDLVETDGDKCLKPIDKYQINDFSFPSTLCTCDKKVDSNGNRLNCLICDPENLMAIGKDGRQRRYISYRNREEAKVFPIKRPPSGKARSLQGDEVKAKKICSDANIMRRASASSADSRAQTNHFYRADSYHSQICADCTSSSDEDGVAETSGQQREWSSSCVDSCFSSNFSSSSCSGAEAGGLMSSNFKPSLDVTPEDGAAAETTGDADGFLCCSVRPDSLQWEDDFGVSAHQQSSCDHPSDEFVNSLRPIFNSRLLDKASHLTNLLDFVLCKYPFNYLLHQHLRRLAKRRRLFFVKEWADEKDSAIKSFVFSSKLNRLPIFKCSSFLIVKEALDISFERYASVFSALYSESDGVVEKYSCEERVVNDVRQLWDFHSEILTSNLYWDDSDSHGALIRGAKILMLLRLLEILEQKSLDSTICLTPPGSPIYGGKSFSEMKTIIFDSNAKNGREVLLELLADTTGTAIEVFEFPNNENQLISEDLNLTIYGAIGAPPSDIIELTATRSTVGRFSLASGDLYLPLL